jgi:uncharacterized membrane protein
MDIFNFILLLVILIVIFMHKSSINGNFEALETKILELKRIIEHLRASQASHPEPKREEAPKPVIKEITQVKPPEEIILPPRPPAPIEIKPEPETVKAIVVEKQAEVIGDSAHVINRPVKTADFVPPKPRVPEPSFFEKHPDLEKFIGENLVNKIGIAILVLAIGYFVKFAIDSGWVGPAGRVGIGIACGAILVGIAHWLRNSYKAFSSVLAGGGLAVFYFTITLAFHQFNLFSQTALRLLYSS